MYLCSKLKLYLVLESNLLKLPLEKFLEEVLKAGVGVIQLRDKYNTYDEKLKTGSIIREITEKYKSIFIVNDSIDLAVKLKADGVHLGINDGDIKSIKATNPNIIIGYSCNNLEDSIKAEQYADYVGIGPYKETNTKKDHRAVLGAKGISNIVKSITIPSVAIGGINLENAKDVLKGNTTGLAVSSYLCSSMQPYDDALKLMEIINERV